MKVTALAPAMGAEITGLALTHVLEDLTCRIEGAINNFVEAVVIIYTDPITEVQLRRA